MELTPIQRRSYIRSDNRHRASRLERCVVLVVELFRTLEEGMKCPARGKKCLTCNKMNHFAKCCRMKGKEDKGVLKAVEKDSDSSDAESVCGI